MSVVATVGGLPVTVDEVDARESQLRSSSLAHVLPARGTSEGRQLRRWLTQLLVAERVVAVEAAALGILPDAAPSEDELLADPAARMEIGSIAASLLADPLARAVFVNVTATVTVTEQEVVGYHARNPLRFAPKPIVRQGWRANPAHPPSLRQVRSEISAHLLGAARRRAFRVWLDQRCVALVELAPGYEHPGDPRQPDNTHKH